MLVKVQVHDDCPFFTNNIPILTSLNLIKVSVISLPCNQIQIKGGGEDMSRLIIKYGSVLASIALFISALASTLNCSYVYHQPEMPDSVRKLRRA